ncbi:MAG: EamA family transporter [Bacteriovoracia bacterium]
MHPETISTPISNLLAGLGASITFAAAAILFREYALRVSTIWMNAFKATVALTAFIVVSIFVSDWRAFITHPQAPTVVGAFLLSGLAGLNIGDFFLVQAFTRLGSSRTLMIFSFQPLLLALGGAVLLSQALTGHQLAAILCLIGCVLILSYERYRIAGRWEIRGLCEAFAGVTLDGVGVLISRWAFEQGTGVDVLQGSLFRCVGACLGFAGLGFFRRSTFRAKPFLKSFVNLSTRDRGIVLIASFMGTFMSLWLWTYAISSGHLASVVALGGTGPLFAALIECLVARRLPSHYLWGALLFFGVGFALML